MKKLSLFIPILITAIFILLVSYLAKENTQSIDSISLQQHVSSNTQPTTSSEITANGKININTASAETLALIPGIGDVLSQRIVSYREEHGPFTDISDLINIRGISESVIARIGQFISVA